MKNIFSVFFSVVFLLSCPHIGSCENLIPPLRVGVILPFTGDAASVGESLRNAMNLALSELPPDVQKKIVLLFEDDRMVPVNTVSAFQKLVSVNKIDLVVTASSGTSNAVSPLAERMKLPHVAIASDKKVVEGRQYVVNFFVTPEEEVRVVIDEAKRRNYKKIARIISLTDGAVATKKAFDDLNHNSLQVILDEEYPLEVKDFRTYLTKVRSRSDLDGILVMLFPGQLGMFAKQARDMGIKAPLFGVEFFEDANEVKASGGALVGCWYVNVDDPTDVFLKKFMDRHPGTSLFAASNGYDLIYLLAEALKTESDREGINKFLHSVKNFTGALGTYSASGDNRFTLPATVKEVTADGFKKIR